MMRRALVLALLLTAAVILLLPLASAHHAYGVTGWQRKIDDCYDDWGQDGTGAMDGQDLVALDMREGTIGGTTGVFFHVTMKGGYAQSPDGTYLPNSVSGPRKVALHFASPAGPATLTFRMTTATNGDPSGTKGFSPEVLVSAETTPTPAYFNGNSAVSPGASPGTTDDTRYFVEFGYTYDQLQAANGEKVHDIQLQATFGDGDQKGDVMNGGKYQGSTYVACTGEPPGSTMYPPEGQLASYTVAASTYTHPTPGGGSSSSSQQTTTPGGPQAAFTLSPTQPCAKQLIAFSDASTAGGHPITARRWDFGDGTTSTDANPTHAWANHGTYTVALAVTDSAGTVGSVSRAIGVCGLAPTAAFSFGPALLVPATEASFVDDSSIQDGRIVAWLWQFGDGTTSAEQNPRHAYASRGAYAANLTITTDAGTQDTARQTVYVRGPPTPAFGLLTDNFHVTADARSASADYGSLVGYAWDWGDGTREAGQAVQTHTYAALGTYTITLNVTDDHGLSAQASQGFAVQADAPTVDFHVQEGKLFKGNVLAFTDATTSISGTPVAWSWDFGDGATSTEQNPRHAFAHAGAHAVRLNVTDDHGLSAQGTRSIHVEAAPSIVLAVRQAGLTLVLDASNSTDEDGNITDYDVLWGDGRETHGRVATHDYVTPGAQTFTVQLTDNDGNIAIQRQAVSLSRRPIVLNASADQTTASPSQLVGFFDRSSSPDGGIVKWTWSFDDGAMSHAPQAIHAFTTPGAHRVTLTVEDDAGRVASMELPLTIAMPPTEKTPPAAVTPVPIPPTAAPAAASTPAPASPTPQAAAEKRSPAPALGVGLLAVAFAVVLRRR
jgi:PKD repeat protein